MVHQNGAAHTGLAGDRLVLCPFVDASEERVATTDEATTI
jgi:aspartate 1-decarboxylase